MQAEVLGGAILQQTFVVEFCVGRMQGQGEMTWPSGDKYIGDCLKNKDYFG